VRPANHANHAGRNDAHLEEALAGLPQASAERSSCGHVPVRAGPSPAPENGPTYQDRSETLVDDASTIVGGCRGEDVDGRTWTCYLGQLAIDHAIIAPGVG
jgi:hypothetical protein